MVSGRRAGSFLRIHVWAVVFLVVISLVLPSHDPVRRHTNNPVQTLTLGLSDQRAFDKSPFGKDRFRIAWIAGSEGENFANGRKSGYVANLVVNELPQIAGRPIGVDMYFLPAMRQADIYFALLDAIASKPDMIVISLNPVWVLDPIATHQWAQLDAKAAKELVGQPTQWPLAASLLSPSDLAFGLAGAAFKPFRDRSYYSTKLQDLVKDLGPLDRSDLAQITKAQKPDRYQALLAVGSPQLLVSVPPARTDAATGPDAWAKWINHSNSGQNGLNKALMRAIAKELRKSKIPSYVYLAQINSGWLATSKPIQNAMGGVEKQLEDMKGDFNAPNIRFQPLNASRFAQPLAFLSGDPVHMRQAGPLGTYIAQQLCRLEAQTGQTDCASPNGGTGNG